MQATLDEELVSLLAHGPGVTIDAPALTPHIRTSYADRAKKNEIRAHLLMITATLDELVAAQKHSGRNREVALEFLQQYVEWQEEFERDLRSGTISAEGWDSVTLVSSRQVLSGQVTIKH